MERAIRSDPEQLGECTNQGNDCANCRKMKSSASHLRQVCSDLSVVVRCVGYISN